MIRSIATITIILLLSGCSESPESVPSNGPQASQPTKDVLTAAAFNQIKGYILAYGDRQTYCNMFNNNPHVALGNMDIYLNPDAGPHNINCDLTLTDFNYMVIRTRKPWKYYRVQLNLQATGPNLIMQQGTKQGELKERFQEALLEIEQRKDNPAKPSMATE